MATGRASGEASSSSRSDYNKMPGHWLLARMGKRVLRPRAVVRGPGRGQAALRAGMAAARRERRLRCPAHIDRAHAPAELAASVPNHIDLGDLIDESVLRQWGADFVVISPNHSREAQLARDLEDSDIAVLTMPNSWDDLDDAYDNILLVGEAIGAEATAQAVVANMKQRERQVQDRLDDLGDRPTVMILTNVAGVPFMIGPGVSTTDFVQRAGGSDASYALGVTTSISPVTAAQIGAAEPDRIVLVDGLGTGRSVFQTLLDDPALAELPVIADDRILVLPARISFGVAHTLIEGLEAIVDWLHPS